MAAQPEPIKPNDPRVRKAFRDLGAKKKLDASAERQFVPKKKLKKGGG